MLVVAGALAFVLLGLLALWLTTWDGEHWVALGVGVAVIAGGVAAYPHVKRLQDRR